MTAPMKEKPRTKISVSLTDEAAEAVESMATEKGLSASEVIRRAIGLSHFVDEELKKGNTFFVSPEADKYVQITFVFA